MDRLGFAWRVCLTLVAIAVPSAAYPAGHVSEYGSDEPVRLEDFRPHLSKSSFYKEDWNINAWTADGRFIAVDFTISNIGLGTHKGLAKARIDSPDGTTIGCKKELSSDEWKSGPDGLALDFGGIRARGDLGAIDVEVDCADLAMRLHFANQGPPYKPGKGFLRFGDAGIYRKSFPAARARVTGTVKARAKAIEVDAPGMIEHSLVDLGPHQFSRRWFRFRHVTSEYTVVLSELLTTDEYAGTRRGYVVVWGPRGELLATANCRFDYDGWLEDSSTRLGYRIPRRVRVVAAEGERELSGTLVLTRVTRIADPTDEWNPVVRALVRAKSKPRNYTLACRYDLELKSGADVRKLSGEADFRFYFVNP